jgi:hypothetical protein
MSLLNRATRGIADRPQPTTHAAKSPANASTPTPKPNVSAPLASVELADVRLAICVPCRDMIHTVFSYNLHSLLQYNWQKGIETKVFYNMSTLLQNQREHLVSAARSWAATHILWLDSDMSFPFYTAYKLLDHKKPVVAGNYVTRQVPYKTVAYRELGQWDSFLRHSEQDQLITDLIPVEGMGMGCMLTDIRVFDSVPSPRFEVEYQSESSDYLGEDINFCIKLRSAGYEILVDDILSRQLHHLGSFAFGHELLNTEPKT